MNNLKRTITKSLFLVMLFISSGQYLYAGNRQSFMKANPEKRTKQLVRACLNGNTTKVKRLLAIPGIDINQVDKDGDTSLYLASYRGHREIIELLLAMPGIDVNKSDSYGCTPLYTASRHGDIEIVKLLLARPNIDINKDDREGYTPFYWAVQYGHTEIVKILGAMSGININQVYEGSYALLYWASLNGLTEVVKILVAIPGIDISQAHKYGETPLYAASQYGRKEIVEQLLAYGAHTSRVAATINTDIWNMIEEVRAIWKHRDKLCFINENADIQLLDDAKLSYTVSQLNVEDFHDIIFLSNKMSMNIIQLIKSVAKKYLDVLNNLDSKAYLKSWHYNELSGIKTIKTLLVRRECGLLNGSIQKLPIDLIAYDIGSFLVPDEKSVEKLALDPLLNRRSHAIRAKTISCDETDISLIEADYAEAFDRLRHKYDKNRL